jgi:hypothetical protein
MALKEAQLWIDDKRKAGAKRIGVSCNPVRRILYVMADDERIEIKCRDQRVTRIIKDIVHDYIAALK